MRTLIVGHGAREAALGARMARRGPLHAFAGHRNPSLIATAERSGGQVKVGDVCDGEAVAHHAQRAGVDMAMVSSDAPLAAGVVDALLARGIPTVGATRTAAEIEWSKAFARELLLELEPDACPRFRVVRRAAEIGPALAAMPDGAVVVKPAGLSGGKGTKLVGPHLDSLDAAGAYAEELLGRGAVVLEERLVGHEFTLQAVTDGRETVFPPATYDYPYRFEDDAGPGTGGMGSFCDRANELPFMSTTDYRLACEVVRKVVARMDALGRPFQGVLNAGFFVTDAGVKVTELNSRFGDPECMNVLALSATSWVDAMRAIVERRLSPSDLRFRRQASVVIYLVPPHYPSAGGEPCEFAVDEGAIAAAGCELHFGSCEQVRPGTYRTVGDSRALAVAATGPSIEAARRRVVGAIERHIVGPLDWRRDIASGPQAQ